MNLISYSNPKTLLQVACSLFNISLLLVQDALGPLPPQQPPLSVLRNHSLFFVLSRSPYYLTWSKMRYLNKAVNVRTAGVIFVSHSLTFSINSGS